MEKQRLGEKKKVEEKRPLVVSRRQWQILQTIKSYEDRNFADARQLTASELGISIGALNSQLTRVRKKLDSARYVSKRHSKTLRRIR